MRSDELVDPYWYGVKHKHRRVAGREVGESVAQAYEGYGARSWQTHMAQAESGCRTRVLMDACVLYTIQDSGTAVALCYEKKTHFSLTELLNHCISQPLHQPSHQPTIVSTIASVNRCINHCIDHCVDHYNRPSSSTIAIDHCN